jgi:hypothetical protein
MPTLRIITRGALLLVVAVPLNGAASDSSSFSPVNPAWSQTLWIPLSDGLDAEGNVRPQVSPAGSAAGLKLLLYDLREASARRALDSAASSGQPCPVSMANNWGRHTTNSPTTFTVLAQAANIAVSGKILSISPGFVLGNLGSLLEVEIEETAKGGPRSGKIFLFYPYVSTQVGHTQACRFDPKYSARPRVSDHVVALIATSPLDKTSTLYAPEAHELLFADINGRLLPQAGAVSDALQFETTHGVIEAVRALSGPSDPRVPDSQVPR